MLMEIPSVEISKLSCLKWSIFELILWNCVSHLLFLIKDGTSGTSCGMWDVKSSYCSRGAFNNEVHSSHLSWRIWQFENNTSERPKSSSCSSTVGKTVRWVSRHQMMKKMDFFKMFFFQVELVCPKLLFCYAPFLVSSLAEIPTRIRVLQTPSCLSQCRSRRSSSPRPPARVNPAELA